jgi:UDP-N-acetylmuramoylalanine--D-glutamate ligase
MFYNQEKSDIAILNLNDKDVLNETNNILSTKKYFSSNKETNCYLKDNWIYYDNEKVINTDVIKIPGIHNIENILGAITVAKEFNVSNEIISDVISNFYGVEHRLEFVKEINGVRFYNDTEATNIKCTQIALSSFKCPVILFLGGLERGQNFEDLTPYMDHVKAIIAIGECRDRIREYAESISKDVYVYEHLADGFDKASQIAEEGDVVLLSPASASWDQYKECEVRGAEFKEKVHELKG